MTAHIVWEGVGDPGSDSLNQSEPSQHEGSSSIREPDLAQQSKPSNSHVVWSRSNSLLRRFGHVRVEKGSSISEDPSTGSLAHGSCSEEHSRQSRMSGGSSRPSRRSHSVPTQSGSVTVNGVTVPKDENGNPTSLGSANHFEGGCKPCLFVVQHRECRNGIDCTFCHFPHKRASAGKRGRLRKYMERAENIIDKDPDQLDHITAKLPASIDQDEKRKTDVIGKLVARANKARMAMGLR